MIGRYSERDGRILTRLTFAAVGVCLLVAGAQALMAPLGQSELAADADGIVLGTVSSVDSRYTDDGDIETTAGIAVESAVKGTFSGADLAVTLQGGTVDGVTQVVEDQPALAPGDRAFFLLDAMPNGFRLHGARLGVVPVVDGEVWVADGQAAPQAVSASTYSAQLSAVANGRDAPVLSGVPATAGGPVIASVSPSSASAGTGTTITITGSGFGSKASRESAADVGFIYRCTSPTTFVPVYASGRPNFGENADGIVSWTDTRIVVRVPMGKMADGYWASASSGAVWVVTDAGASSGTSPFTVTFGYGGLKWASAPTFVVNSNCPGQPAAGAAVASAARTWNTALAGSSLRFVDGGSTTSTTIGKNGQNLICWRPASDFADPTMLALTDWWYVGPNLVECDVKLNSAISWTTGTASGSTRNIEAVMLHEFGHWVGLRDLYGYRQGAPTDLGKVMFGWSNADFGNLNRKTLSEWEIAGARYIYGGGTAPASVSTMLAVPGAAGTPRDLDGDGKYEDLSGNGRADYADVVLYFEQLSWIAANEPVSRADNTGDGRVDFADVVWLFDRL